MWLRSICNLSKCMQKKRQYLNAFWFTVTCRAKLHELQLGTMNPKYWKNSIYLALMWEGCRKENSFCLGWSTPTCMLHNTSLLELGQVIESEGLHITVYMCLKTYASTTRCVLSTRRLIIFRMQMFLLWSGWGSILSHQKSRTRTEKQPRYWSDSGISTEVELSLKHESLMTVLVKFLVNADLIAAAEGSDFIIC
jgi:hypothetical protein